jgi:uncharacterized protein (TIGR03435 family)
MIRNGALAVAVILILVICWAVIGVRTQPAAARGWREFSMGPAHGQNTSISLNEIHSDGMSLLVLFSVAYAMPRTRILGPQWLQQDLFAITAVAPADDSLPDLLQQELRNRLGIRAHLEDRDFASFVLTANHGAAHLIPAQGSENRNYVRLSSLESQDTRMSDLCNVLQSILGKPVVDETRIPGRYDFTLAWGENRERSITDALDTKYGLTLTPATRRLPALIVDRADRGTSVAILSGVGRLTSGWPQGLRRSLSRALSTP